MTTCQNTRTPRGDMPSHQDLFHQTATSFRLIVPRNAAVRLNLNALPVALKMPSSAILPEGHHPDRRVIWIKSGCYLEGGQNELISEFFLSIRFVRCANCAGFKRGRWVFFSEFAGRRSFFRSLSDTVVVDDEDLQ